MAVITFDAAIFRTQCPAYADATAYPDATLQQYWNQAICYISNDNYGYLVDECRRAAINYMLAHILTLSIAALAGTVATAPGFVNSSSVDRASVSIVPPPGKSQFKWWLNQTTYGQALVALLGAKSAGGFFAGSNFPRGGIRQPWGGFLS